MNKKQIIDRIVSSDFARREARDKEKELISKMQPFVKQWNAFVNTRDFADKALGRKAKQLGARIDSALKKKDMKKIFSLYGQMEDMIAPELQDDLNYDDAALVETNPGLEERVSPARMKKYKASEKQFQKLLASLKQLQPIANDQEFRKYDTF